jgi:hypothetical protein
MPTAPNVLLPRLALTLRAALWFGPLLLPSIALAQSSPQALAEALQQTARAGNAAAYRKLLAPSGTFSVESSNFAADLARNAPRDVRYTFSRLKLFGTRATADLTLDWTRTQASEGQTDQETGHVTFPVQLVRVGEVWRYAGEAFEPVSTQTGTLLALAVPGLRERVVPIAPLLMSAAEKVRSVLGLTVPKGAVVKVYPDGSSLSASVYLSLPPVNGWSEPGEAIKIVLASGSRAEINRAALHVLTHEFTHLAVSQAVGQAKNKRIPWWLHEGLANFVSFDSLSVQYRTRLLANAQGSWIPLSSLADFQTVPEYAQDNAYSQGLAVVQFLAQTKGKDRPWQLTQTLADTGQADAAADAVGFASFAALETATQVWLATTGRDK